MTTATIPRMEAMCRTSAVAWRFVACDLCGADDAAVVHRERVGYFGEELSFTIVRCRGCGLVYTNPRLAESNAVYLEDEPDVEAIEGHAKAKAAVFTKALDRIERLRGGGTGARLLDVGCGSGHFVAAARQRGYEATGLEPAGAYARYAREVLGLEVEAREATEAELEEERFDVVTAFDVLEHVESPAGVMERVASWLRPGGVFAGRFPSARFHRLKAAVLHGLLHSGRSVYAPTMHLTFFDVETFERLARQVGLEVVEARTTRLEANTASWWLNGAKRAAQAGLWAARGVTGREWGNLEVYCRKVER